MSNIKYLAQIPARIGSKRVKMKNLRIMAGKPMIQYAIEACMQVDLIGRVCVNSDNEVIGKFAEKLGADFYHRPEELASDFTKQDEFNYDFLKNNDCEVLILVNPVAPLVETDDIRRAIDMFENEQLDTLVTCRQEKLHSFFEGNALNFDADGMLPPTQDILPVDICTWTVSMWRKDTFIKSFEENGYAVFSGKVGLCPISPINSLKVSYESDFLLVEHIINSRSSENNKISTPVYYNP